MPKRQPSDECRNENGRYDPDSKGSDGRPRPETDMGEDQTDRIGPCREESALPECKDAHVPPEKVHGQCTQA